MAYVSDEVSQNGAPPPEAAHRVRWWQRALVWPFSLLARLWMRTLRVEVDPAIEALYRDDSRQIAIVLWHNRLFAACEVYRRYRTRQIHALVSASKDGAWLDAFFESIGVHSARGSSSRMGREAVTELIARYREGRDIGITPDGPRGPCYEFKPGALIVARRVQCPMLLMGLRMPRAFRLGSWDRFVLPHPFSKIYLSGVLVEPAEFSGDRDEAATDLGRRLREMNPD